MRFNERVTPHTFFRSRTTLHARTSAIVVSISLWLVAGAATAAGPMFVAGANAGRDSAALPFRSADRDLLQSDSLPTRFLRATIGARRRSNHRDFPASPPGFGALTSTTPETLAMMSSSRPRSEYRQSGAFHFEHSGGAVVREIPRGYDRMCDALSGHIWNEPQGKRLCFDMRGKPGIAIQIPIH